MNEKKQYILKLAKELLSCKQKMSGKELAIKLNHKNYLTSYGTKYKGGRGTYKLIRETYHSLVNLKKHGDAEIIASVFVTPNGRPAHEK